VITIFKNTDDGLVTVEEVVSGCWISVIDPTPDELNRLPQELGFPQDFLTYPLDVDELSRTEKEDNVTLIILRIPYQQSETADIPYITVPLGIILTDQYVITVCKMQNRVLQELTNGRWKTLSTAKRYRFVLRLLYGTAGRYLAYLREINKMVDSLEDRLQQSLRNREVLELLKYEKSLVYFETALKSNELMMERLQRGQMFKTYPEDEDLLEDVLTENQQAIQMVGIANNILSQMMDAFASIISNNLNQVMKLLASVTIVMAIPTMLASFYGMNVKLPLINEDFDFGIVLCLSLFISIVTATVFVRRDWF
jgi:magnesium transporter